ncbi:hypothetical protein ACRRTK_001413 [Alexandromys fortis]
MCLQPPELTSITLSSACREHGWTEDYSSTECDNDSCVLQNLGEAFFSCLSQLSLSSEWIHLSLSIES